MAKPEKKDWNFLNGKRLGLAQAKLSGGVVNTTLDCFGVGTTSPGTGASQSGSLEDEGPFVAYTTGITSGNMAGWLNGIGQTKRSLKPRAEVVIKTGSSVDNCRIWAGYSNGVFDTTAIYAHVAAFQYSSAFGDGKLRCVTNDGGADPGTVTVTSIDVVADKAYVLEVDLSSLNKAEFYVDGELVATHTTNLPSLTELLGIGPAIYTLAANDPKTLKIKSLFVLAD